MFTKGVTGMTNPNCIQFLDRFKLLVSINYANTLLKKNEGNQYCWQCLIIQPFDFQNMLFIPFLPGDSWSFGGDSGSF